MIDLPCYIAGEAVTSGERLKVTNPYTGDGVGSVAALDRRDTVRAIETTRASSIVLTRYQRAAVLERAGVLLEERRGEFSQLITAEAGLCIRESTYEVGRALDVLHFAAIEALRDDGQVYSCDITAQGKARKIFTLREPLGLVAAITPFNHPLNQVVHKVAPAVAAGVPLVLKPSEKTPLTAIRFVELLYEAGLPGELLSVVLGPIPEVAATLVRHPDIDLLSFTGSAQVGKQLAAEAGYKRLCLELGGNSPLIVLADADLELAVGLAAEGAFRNSGQRCTAVKRILVEESVRTEFTERLATRTCEYTYGDPSDPDVRVGTVIDEEAAQRLEALTLDAKARGARVLAGGQREGAVLAPTLLADVPRDAPMVVEESFGPLAPVLGVKDVDDAISLANSTAYGLSAGVVTRDMEAAIRVIKSLRTGTVNVNEVPGYRLESSPFGGTKDSGLGIKEGVVEAIKFMTTVKTFSLPW